MKASWYKTWFNSKYYHILYHHRDEEEAGNFLENLIQVLPLKTGSKIIDVGCGRGRHAIYLSERGFRVKGIDLSKPSIMHARQFENDHLSFDVHDMRDVYRTDAYDCVLNLFTSFGYFSDDADDFRSLRAMTENLKKGGSLVLDYMNTSKVEEEIEHCSELHITMDNILFRIDKNIDGNFIEKRIDIKDGKEKHLFFERVKRLKPEQFKKQMEEAGLTVEHLYGDYQLHDFDEKHSDRMIFIARKK